MVNGLKEHFPMIRDREEVIAEIRSKQQLMDIYEKWEEDEKTLFLDYCTGVRGVKMLYDHFFKAIINPDAAPERLEELLSLILRRRVKILKVLPSDSSRIAAESSLLIMDVIVQLEDGSIANVEAQKIGYSFPGQRSSCYSADLLLRQYKRVKGELGKKFSYRDMKKVYSIIFFEKSTKEFHQYPDAYIHYIKNISDTGLAVELLQEYVFIPLDIFRRKLDNEGVSRDNKLEAWLTFLSEDEPERILELLEKYPEFEALYEEVYEMCLNMERMMEMFSKELAELDKNTVQYMIDEMQSAMNEMQSSMNEMQGSMNEMQETIDEKDKQLGQKDKQIEELKKLLRAKQEE